jgi:transcriptional regulator with XRE-family HTH domain
MLAKETLEEMRPQVQELADALGVHRRTVNFWLQGERTPSAENLEALADLADDQSDRLYTLARRLRDAAEREGES